MNSFFLAAKNYEENFSINNSVHIRFIIWSLQFVAYCAGLLNINNKKRKHKVRREGGEMLLLLKQEMYNGMRYKRCKADEQQPEGEEKNNKCKCIFSKEIYIFFKYLPFFKPNCFFFLN